MDSPKLSTEPLEQGRERLHAEWVGWLNYVLPPPGLALGFLAVSQSEHRLLSGGVMTAYFMLNIGMSQLTRWGFRIDAVGWERFLLNAGFLLIFSWVCGPDTHAWTIGAVPIFAGLASDIRARRLRAMIGFTIAPVLGAWLGGDSLGELAMAAVVLSSVAWLAWHFHESLGGVWRRAMDRELALAAKAEQLEQALDSRRSFLATMSHEIRTPLNGILGMGELLRMSRLDGEQRQMVDSLVGSGQGLLQVLNDILDTSKLEAGKVELVEEAFDPSELARSTVQLLGCRAGPELSLEVEVDMLPPALLGDAGRLRQVLLNLVGNALKFTSQGRVLLRMRWEADQLHVAVEDTGIGIAPEHQHRLMEPFEQAEAGTTRSYGGTGLGLSISRRLVELMGGELRLESELGKGSCFCFTIAAPKTDAPTALAQEEWRLSGRVLVVEDNPVNMMVTSRLLESMGCEVLQAVNGVQALAAIKQSPSVSLILMDCRMPEMDGLEATRRLRAQGLETPILALTAGVTEEERRACAEAGMDGVLPKPLARQDLFQALAPRLSRAA